MALLNRVTIEQQVAILAEIGITVNDGVAVDDFTAFEISSPYYFSARVFRRTISTEQ